MPDLAPSASPPGRRISPIPAVAPSRPPPGARFLRARIDIRQVSRDVGRDPGELPANPSTRARDLALRLDAVSPPAHLHGPDADTRFALSSDQPSSGAMGAAGHSLVRARVYRWTGPWLAAHPTDRLRRPVLAWENAPERRQHRRSPGLLRLWGDHRRPARQRPVLRSALLLLPSDRDSSKSGKAEWPFMGA